MLEHGISYIKSDLSNLMGASEIHEKKDAVISIYTFHIFKEPLFHVLDNFKTLLNDQGLVISVYFEQAGFHNKLHQYHTQEEVKKHLEQDRNVLDRETYQIDKDKVHAFTAKKKYKNAHMSVFIVYRELVFRENFGCEISTSCSEYSDVPTDMNC